MSSDVAAIGQTDCMNTPPKPFFTLEVVETAPNRVVFTTELPPAVLRDFLYRSGDGNIDMHDPVDGKGIVQGLVWTTLFNQALSLRWPGRLVLVLTCTIGSVCYARKGWPPVPVCIQLEQVPGTSEYRCQITAPRRQRAAVVTVFQATVTLLGR